MGIVTVKRKDHFGRMKILGHLVGLRGCTVLQNFKGMKSIGVWGQTSETPVIFHTIQEIRYYDLTL